MLPLIESTHLFLEFTGLSNYEHDYVADSNSEQPASLQHGLHVAWWLGEHKDTNFSPPSSSFSHHLVETNLWVIIFNAISLYLSDRHFYTECIILLNIILFAFFTGAILKFRPCVIAQEAILLFSVVSKLSVIWDVWVKRPLPVSKRTPVRWPRTPPLLQWWGNTEGSGRPGWWCWDWCPSTRGCWSTARQILHNYNWYHD